MSNDIPNVGFGAFNAPLPDWRKEPDPSGPDDDELPSPFPADVAQMLGFDPTADEDLFKSERVIYAKSNWQTIDDATLHSMADIVQRALNNCRDAVIAHVSSKMSKAVPTPEEEARLLTAALRLEDELSVIVEIAPMLQDVGTEAGRDAVNSVLQSKVDSGDPVGYDSAIWTTIDENMANYAKQRSAELIGMRYDENGNLVPAKRAQYRIDETTRTMLNDSLSSAIRAGMTAAEIQQGLMEDYAFSPARALTIARTEAAFAHSRGAMTGYRETQKALDLHMQKAWSTADDEVVCEECMGNEEAGWIEMDEEFPSGDDATPAHPNCRCDIIVRTVDSEKEA